MSREDWFNGLPLNPLETAAFVDGCKFFKCAGAPICPHYMCCIHARRLTLPCIHIGRIFTEVDLIYAWFIVEIFYISVWYLRKVRGRSHLRTGMEIMLWPANVVTRKFLVRKFGYRENTNFSKPSGKLYIRQRTKETFNITLGSYQEICTYREIIFHREIDKLTGLSINLLGNR